MKDKFSLINKLSVNPKIPLLFAGAAAIAILIVAFLWAQSKPYGVLFANIEDKDGGEIVSRLEQMKVPYKFSSSGTAILIPDDQVHETRLRLAQQGLPNSGVVGFELLDKERFGISQFSEQVNYQRALEGELARTITTLRHVENARVHLAIPKPSLFVRERKPPSASVSLILSSGRTLSQQQVKAITHLIASSVPELTADQITLVDQHGDLLTNDEPAGTNISTTQLDYTEKVESRIRRRIEKLLMPLLGKENITVQVSADVDFSRHESTSEIFDPNNKPENQAIRSQQHNEQKQLSLSTGIGGVPGALSNQPIPVTSAPIDDPDQAASPMSEQESSEKNENNPNDNIGKQEQDAVPKTLHRNDTINYEVSRKSIHSHIPEGIIKRLSVAVVVNYSSTEMEKRVPGSKKVETIKQFSPLDEPIIITIESLTKQAMGFSAERGDSITVANLKFSESEPIVVDTPIWKQPTFHHLVLTLGRYFLFLIIAWLVWIKLLKPVWRRWQAHIIDDQAALAVSSETIMPAEGAGETRDARYRRIFESSLQQQKYFRETVANDPKVTANILRNWINRDLT